MRNPFLVSFPEFPHCGVMCVWKLPLPPLAAVQLCRAPERWAGAGEGNVCAGRMF